MPLLRFRRNKLNNNALPQGVSWRDSQIEDEENELVISAHPTSYLILFEMMLDIIHVFVLNVDEDDDNHHSVVVVSEPPLGFAHAEGARHRKKMVRSTPRLSRHPKASKRDTSSGISRGLRGRGRPSNQWPCIESKMVEWKLHEFVWGSSVWFFFGIDAHEPAPIPTPTHPHTVKGAHTHTHIPAILSFFLHCQRC